MNQVIKHFLMNTGFSLHFHKITKFITTNNNISQISFNHWLLIEIKKQRHVPLKEYELFELTNGMSLVI